MERSEAFVMLDYSTRNAAICAQRQGYERLQTSSGPMWLFFYRVEGLSTAGVTLDYLRELALDGYIGLQRIPRWSIIR